VSNLLLVSVEDYQMTQYLEAVDRYKHLIQSGHISQNFRDAVRIQYGLLHEEAVNAFNDAQAIQEM